MKFYTTKSNARRAAKQAGITEFEIIEKDGKFAYKELKKEITKQAEPIKGIPLTNKSVVDKPVKLVWHIADEMFAAAEANGDDQPRRKDVLAECVKRGIAFYTARTQYQQWWLCRNGKY